MTEKTTYSGTFNKTTAGTNGQSVFVSGEAIPAYAEIKRVSFTLEISASPQNSTKTWELHWFAIGDPNGSPYAAKQSAQMSDIRHTFSGDMIFAESDAEQFASGSFEVYAKANTTHDVTSYMDDFTITVEYEPHTPCEAPTSVSIQHERTAAAKNVLSWDGAEEGENNSIAGYFVEYADSKDGETWGDWVEIGSVETSETSASMTVDMPDANTFRKWKVWTLGTADGYDSETGTESPASYRGHDPLEGFTDSPLVPGVTPVKALHMTELQDRTNTLRTFYGLTKCAFSAITAGVSGLADWTAHIMEIRAALDEIARAASGDETNISLIVDEDGNATITGASLALDEDGNATITGAGLVLSADGSATVGNVAAGWLEIPVNCPRADVIEQLRAVVLSL